MSHFEDAKKIIPGGVNSPVRALNAVGVEPPFIKQGKGVIITTEDGRELLDFCMSWGALLMGHANHTIISAVKKQVELGTSFGIPTTGETKLAQLICDLVPSIEQVRLVSSGTEAGMSAIRLARGFTGRSLIVKFDGCYHGHSDSLLVGAGSGVSELPKSFSAGVPDEIVSQTISIPYNDEAAIGELVATRGSEIATVIVEPVAGNMGLVVPDKRWLQLLRNLTTEHKSVLIFDEVISGFRVAPGGAQEIFGITPDLTCLGKIMGGGFPAAAFGGKREIMNHLSPLGDVYQAGTLSGNPVAVAAGIAMLTYIKENRALYQDLANTVSRFAEKVRATSTKQITTFGSMFTIFHCKEPVCNFADAQTQSAEEFRKFWLKAYKAGIYLPPSMFETAFISTKHTDADFERLLAIIAES